MKDGTGTESRGSTELEYAPESPCVGELPPDAPWAAWWDGLEDGLTTSRRAVLGLERRPERDDAQEQTAVPA